MTNANPTEPRCKHCGAPLPPRTPGVPGRRRQFCTPWHGKAYRARLMTIGLDGTIYD